MVLDQQSGIAEFGDIGRSRSGIEAIGQHHAHRRHTTRPQHRLADDQSTRALRVRLGGEEAELAQGIGVHQQAGHLPAQILVGQSEQHRSRSLGLRQ